MEQAAEMSWLSSGRPIDEAAASGLLLPRHFSIYNATRTVTNKDETLFTAETSKNLHYPHRDEHLCNCE